MFNPREFLSFCEKKVEKPKKFKKTFREYLKNKSFYGWIFNPASEQLVDYAGQTEAFYSALCGDIYKLELIEELISDDPRAFGHATAAFLFSLANFGIDTANKAFNTVNEMFANKELSRSECEKKKRKIEEYGGVVNKLIDAIGEIIKKDAKVLANETGVPKRIARIALRTIPEPIFIPNAKVKLYLELILPNIYSDINEREADISDINWKAFFDYLFGPDMRYDVAYNILLESPNVLSDLKSKSTAKVFDSITAYALKTLDKADDNSRSHMIEVYLKQLTSVLKGSKEASVRVDLRSISEKEFPNLSRTISKYHDRFDKVFGVIKT